MAAPTPTARPTPGGQQLGNGNLATITIAADTDIEFFEEEVSPPGLDMEDAIETSTQHNTRWQTFHPGDLIRLTEFDVVAGYDPIVFQSLVAILGHQTTITITWNNGDTLCFYGYVKAAKPTALKRREKPKMTITIMPTNADPTTCAEQGPVYTAGAGTGCF